mgnify:FL=1
MGIFDKLFGKKEVITKKTSQKTKQDLNISSVADLTRNKANWVLNVKTSIKDINNKEIAKVTTQVEFDVENLIDAIDPYFMDDEKKIMYLWLSKKWQEIRIEIPDKKMTINKQKVYEIVPLWLLITQDQKIFDKQNIMFISDLRKENMWISDYLIKCKYMWKQD